MFLKPAVVTIFVVVQLFNAVNKQQKELQTQLEAVGSSETKRSKGLFICIHHVTNVLLQCRDASVVCQFVKDLVSTLALFSANV